LISTIIIMLIGNKTAKRYFGYVQIINLLTIWNPLFSNFIAKYFTSAATFWRILWLIPIEFAISYCIVEIIQKAPNTKIKVQVFSIMMLILIIPGKFIYSLNLIENLENIPQYIVKQTNYILESDKQKEEIVVLAPPEPLHGATMRQMTSKIKLIQSRKTYIGKINNEQEQKERLNLIDIYNNHYEYTTNQFKKLIDKYEIDWIIIERTNDKLVEYIENAHMKKICEIEGYILYNTR